VAVDTGTPAALQFIIQHQRSHEDNEKILTSVQKSIDALVSTATDMGIRPPKIGCTYVDFYGLYQIQVNSNKLLDPNQAKYLISKLPFDQDMMAKIFTKVDSSLLKLIPSKQQWNNYVLTESAIHTIQSLSELKIDGKIIIICTDPPGSKIFSVLKKANKTSDTFTIVVDVLVIEQNQGYIRH